MITFSNYLCSDWQMLPQYWIAFPFWEMVLNHHFVIDNLLDHVSILSSLKQRGFIRGSLVNNASGSDTKMSGSGWIKTKDCFDKKLQAEVFKFKTLVKCNWSATPPSSQSWDF